MDFQNLVVSYFDFTDYCLFIEIKLLIVIFEILRNFRIILLVLLMLFYCNQLIAVLIFNSFDLEIVL